MNFRLRNVSTHAICVLFLSRTQIYPCCGQVCNKYFLKAHKQKMHGIEEEKRTTPTKDVRHENGTGNSQPPLPTLSMQQQGLPMLPSLQAMSGPPQSLQQAVQSTSPTMSAHAQLSADANSFNSSRK